MAWIQREAKTGYWQLRFRYGGREYKRSLETTEEDIADRQRARVEDTILLIKRGRVVVPDGADIATFLLSDGKLATKGPVVSGLTLANVVADYQASLPVAAKAATTLATEKIHFDHIQRIVKAKTHFASIDHDAAQRYVERRAREKHRGKPIGAETIRKELSTLGLLWLWARKRGIVAGENPIVGVSYPKRADKQPFKTHAEITAIIARGGLSAAAQDDLWESLFLSTAEVAEVLKHVKKRGGQPYVYPLFAFAAWTGARRSEILRARIEDFNFQTMTVTIREKKRVHGRSMTFRNVPMSTELAATMRSWFASHPGGHYAITNRPEKMWLQTPVKAFDRALKGSKWEVIRGFHVFRHSFASNLAAAGVSQALIDSWLGHQSEAMRARYRHLLPAETRRGIEALGIDAVLGAGGSQ